MSITRKLVFASTARDGGGASIFDAAKVEAAAADASLSREQSMTPFGDALKVLASGPEDDAERALACALFAHVIAQQPPVGREEEDRAASDPLWLAARTPFDATGLLDVALGERADGLWDAISDRIRRIDRGQLPSLTRGEALVGAVALAQSTSKAATRHAASLITELRDPKLVHALRGPSAPAAAAPDARNYESIVGELTAARNPVWTTVLALTGVLFLIHIGRLLGWLLFAYRRPAEVTISGESIRIKYKTILLGKVVQERDLVIPRAGLVSASRDVRYPQLAFYAGLLALALGCYFGMTTFVDGARVGSPTLLIVAIVAIVLGIAIDMALSTLTAGLRGRCRMVFVAKTRSLEVSPNVAASVWPPSLAWGWRRMKFCVRTDADRADAALSRLASGFGVPAARPAK